jgi:hypothetical protein
MLTFIVDVGPGRTCSIILQPMRLQALFTPRWFSHVGFNESFVDSKTTEFGASLRMKKMTMTLEPFGTFGFSFHLPVTVLLDQHICGV